MNSLKRLLQLILLSILSVGGLSSCKKTVMIEDIVKEEQAQISNPYFRSIEEAQKDLEEILSEKSGLRLFNEKSSRKIVNSFSSGRNYNQNLRSSDSIIPEIHIFNFEGEEGFAIMSADKRLPALFALTTEGSLSPDKEVESPEMIMFLERLEQYIDQNKEQKKEEIEDSHDNEHYLETKTVYGAWHNRFYDRYMSNGLCSVKWTQEAPYNKFCPKVKNDTKHAYTGCVPTAVAQLMSIFEHPSSYGEYSFNWSDMKQRAELLKDPSTIDRYNAATDDIARLMQQLGLPENLNVRYEDGESPSSKDFIPRTLKNFGYTDGGRIIKYSTLAVVPELKSGNYLLITGGEGIGERVDKTFLGIPIKTTQYLIGGHCWLAHGLLEKSRKVRLINKNNGKVIEEEDEVYWYILCNFGYEYSSNSNAGGDGYYLSGVFDLTLDKKEEWFGRELRSTVTPGHFKDDLHAIIGIRK